MTAVAPARPSDDLVAVGRSTMSTTYNPQPIILQDGRGVRVRDRDGRQYLDFLAGIAVCALGHGHPTLVQRLTEQLQRGVTHVSNGFFTEPQILLQERLVQRSFADRVFLCNSGTEANEAAIKLARRYQRVVRGTPRFEIITFDASFHGRTYGALSATAQPKYHAGFEPMVPGFVHATFNDIDSVRARVGAHTAAIMLEVVQGEGGVRPADPAFLRAVRELCDEQGLLLIVDEVQTGIGRTGEWFAYQHSGVTPDIMTLAKGLGGGVPVGAMVATDEIFRGFERGSHATTFGGNPLATTAALAVLDVIEDEGLLANVSAMARHFETRIDELRARQSRILETRGLGLLRGVVIDGTADDALRIVSAARQRGLLMNTAGGNVLRFVPPLTITAQDIDEAVAIVEAAIDEALPR